MSSVYYKDYFLIDMHVYLAILRGKWWKSWKKWNLKNFQYRVYVFICDTYVTGMRVLYIMFYKRYVLICLKEKQYYQLYFVL